MTEKIETVQDASVEKESKPEKNNSFTIEDLLKAGVHFGHKTLRWNPKMAPYIYGERNRLHIIDLTQTAILLSQAAQIMKELTKAKGKILFVATKKQASETIAETAKKCGQYYVNHKWLGGMLTNWKTISKSIKTLRDIETQLENTEVELTKKERLLLDRKRAKLERNLGGIRNLSGKPDLLFVIDTNRESLAITEAKSLGIPVMAIIDTNSNPDLIDYPIPGNDDSIKAIKLYCKVLEEAILDGREALAQEQDVVKKTKVTRTVKVKEEEKAPAKKAEPKAPAVKEEKVPAEIKEVAPAVKEEKVPAVEKKAKAPAKKTEKKVPAKKKVEKAPAKKIAATKKKAVKKTTKK